MSVNHRIALVIFFVALVHRLLFFAAACRQPDGFHHLADSHEYHRLAVNLIEGRGFSMAGEAPWTPDVRRTPLFPALVAAVYRLFGAGPAPAVAVNLLLSAWSCVLVYRLGARLFSPAAGALAGGLLALDLASAVYANLLLTESLFTFLLLISMLALARYLDGGRVAYAALAGALLGLATLCRPISLYMAWCVGLVIGLAGPARRGRALRDYLVYALSAVVMMMPWVYRNYRVAGIAQLTTQGSLNLYHERAARILLESGQGYTGGVGAPAAPDAMQAQARAILWAHWPLYLRQHGRGILEMMGGGRSVALESLEPRPPMPHWLSLRGYGPPPVFPPQFTMPTGPLGKKMLRLAEWLALLAVTTAAAIGAAAAWRGGRRPGLLLAGLAVAYFLLVSGPEAYSRFRVPLMPLLALLAGWGGLYRHQARKAVAS